ncbi:tripartite tricarboxylate transporter substrate binding protein [Pigmentiphaga litoralis]|uniref:tripartite tricarboxylate transporter substrate binding protein n=1 Tax=Pigmentiphaga litoralis TaxID=516702 RepID=UPI003B43CF19
MTPHFTRRAFSAALVSSFAMAFAAPALAADANKWPAGPIEIVVGFAAGGGTDITARTVAQHLSKKLNVPVIVSNKAGASGEIGLSYVARAKPDGYVLGMTNMPGLVSIPIERKARYQASDFTYIANLVRDPSAFSVLNTSKYKSLADLVADAKANPGKISYGSTGVGTDDHLALVQFEQLTGVDLNHIPFNGAGPLRNAVLGGQVDVGGMNVGEVMPFKDRVTVLGQASDGRSPLAEDARSFKEQGVNLVFASERGIIAPAGVPTEVTQTLTRALRDIAQDPEFIKQTQSQFTEMDYVEGAAWKTRLDKATEGFKKLWTTTPWSDS